MNCDSDCCDVADNAPADAAGVVAVGAALAGDTIVVAALKTYKSINIYTHYGLDFFEIFLGTCLDFLKR